MKKLLIIASAALAFAQTVWAQTDIVITQPASTSTNSVVIGASAATPVNNYINNVVVGYRAGQANISQNTVFVGAFSGYSGGAGRGAQHTVGIGAFAGYGQYLGSYNVMVGDSAGFGIGSAINNVMIGASAGIGGGSGGSNTFVGNQAGRNTSSGGLNTFVGFSAGRNNEAGNANVFFGSYAGQSLLSGSYNTFIGAGAGRLSQSGIENTFVGTNAGARTNGQSNTMIGTYAGQNNTTGQFNTFMGVQAGQSNTTGSSNFIMGTNAGSANTTGNANFFLGDNTGSGNATGGYNVYLGTNAGSGSGVNGDNNTAIGFESGRQNGGGVTNLFLGFRADAGANGLTNATAIGPNAKVSISNALVLGAGTNVGIGTTAPTNKLHIVSSGGGQSGLRLENLTSGTAASVTNQTKFLTVDGSGNVILGSTTSSTRRAAAADLWELKGDQLQTVSGDKVVIGRGGSRTPAGYKLFVEGGILTEKVKVAVKNTTEWSDHVFKKDYPLRPLKEVEQHIKRSGHLPGVPSAAEMVEQGNDLHRTDAKLLEKIEELTLYSIQLEKTTQDQRQTLQQQQHDIDELKKLVRQLLQRK